ncbi:hypothetical protein Tco_0505361 [Tanacetum coccineum]
MAKAGLTYLSHQHEITVAGNNSSEKGWPLLNNFLRKGVWQYAKLLESNDMVLRLHVVVAKDERGKSEGINVRRKHVSVLNAVARIHREAMSAPVAVRGLPKQDPPGHVFNVPSVQLHCIETSPYILTELVTEAVPVTEDQQGQPRRVEQETYANTTLENRKLIDAEAEAIHTILNRIGDDIYSIVDACSIAREMWLAIERLQQRESINNQDVKTKLVWEFGKFTSRDGESIESCYLRFYKMMNEMVRSKLKVDTMQQHQNEVNEIRAEKLPEMATHSHYSHATTRNKSKEIAKPITPPSEEDNDPEQAQREKDMHKNLSLTAKKPKRAKDFEYHKDKMMLSKQESKVVPLSAE